MAEDPRHGPRRPRPRRSPWTLRDVEEAKAAVKAALDARLGEGAPGSERLRAALEEIAALDGATEPAAQLRRYVAVVFALVQHQRAGGLTPRQTRDLADLAHALLQVNGVEPRTSGLSLLHGELCVVLSQIHRKDGRHWASAWEQSLAGVLAEGAPAQGPGGDGFLAVGMADRALRLGLAGRALARYAEAETAAGAPPVRREKARLGRVKALRLAGRAAEAAELAEATARESWLSADGRLELAWEEMCRDLCAAAGGDMLRMTAVVKRGRSHHHASYLLDAWLYAHAVRGKRWRAEVPTIRYLARKKSGVHLQAMGAAYEGALALERCYDGDIPLPLRLARLGEALARADEVQSVDKEMLLWAAAARWLTRIRAHETAAIALGRYEGHSLALTSGHERDVLGVSAGLRDATDDD